LRFVNLSINEYDDDDECNYKNSNENPPGPNEKNKEEYTQK